METVSTPRQMQDIALRLRREGKRIGFVPTMGFLHEGHLSLVRVARKNTDVCVVSVFVNPTQFGPEEDLARYPRDLERDKKKLAAEKVDYLFVPSETDIYPKDYSTYVVEESLANHLEGASRPSHFRGVCTVVTKLFHIVQPDVAVFGQKDAQQAAVIKRMVRDLNFPVEIILAPTAREADGLAMSSRNSYLTDSERKQAHNIHAALQWATDAFHKGQKEAAEIRKGMVKIILYGPQAKIDYIEFVNPETFERQEIVHKGTLIVLAVRFGKTRLIDNMLLE